VRIAGDSDDAVHWRPPTPSPGATATPFFEWASRRRLKVAVAVAGGLLALGANDLAASLLKVTPRPTVVTLRVATGDNVCWKVVLGLGGPAERHCGDATLSLRAESGAMSETMGIEGKFFATVTKVFRTEVNSRRVTVTLLADDREVDRASTTYDSASVSY
jgi:hypothetical protein